MESTVSCSSDIDIVAEKSPDLEGVVEVVEDKKPLVMRDEYGRLMKGSRLNMKGPIGRDYKYAVKKLSGKYAEDAINTLHKIMMDEGALHSVRIKCAELILDRAVGKAMQPIEVKDEERRAPGMMTGEQIQAMVPGLQGLLDSVKEGNIQVVDVEATEAEEIDEVVVDGA